MTKSFLVQGRQLESEDILHIQQLILANPNWSRRRLSEELCAQWQWRNDAGRLKDMAARSLLLKLHLKGLIRLPERRQKPSNRMILRRIPRQTWNKTPIMGVLQDLEPLAFEEVSVNPTWRFQFAAALAEFHYLSCRGTVGENLQYMVWDKAGRLLACLLFGAAAWKCRARDGFIGWNQKQRARHLHLITSNSRFLILPWVRVPNLASAILGRVLKRLSIDWTKKYHHPLILAETFVERYRFPGTCYKAANWVCIGSTVGRGRQDRQHTVHTPIKDVYVYPLSKNFRGMVCS